MRKLNKVEAWTMQLRVPVKINLILGICLSCVLLLVYTGYAKIEDHDRFYKGLIKVNYLKKYALQISWSVPLSELFIAALLIIPKTQKLGLSLFIGLMSLFTLYILSMLLWAAKLPCHCGGALEKLSWTAHVWFNLSFIALAGLGRWLLEITKINTFKI